MFCDIRSCQYNSMSSCLLNADTCDLRDLEKRNRAEEPIQYGDEDEPILRCPSCDEDVTDLMDCGINFCPHCGKRWYGK